LTPFIYRLTAWAAAPEADGLAELPGAAGAADATTVPGAGLISSTGSGRPSFFA
jgi:hypothetical protein